jgi:hypothetical protein
LQHQKWEQHNLQGKVTEIATDIVVEKAIMPNASVTKVSVKRLEI